MVRFMEMGRNPEMALNSARSEDFHREITFYRESKKAFQMSAWWRAKAEGYF